MEDIAHSRCNARYLPRLQLPESIRMTSDFAALDPAELLVFVVPSRGIHEVARLTAAIGIGREGSIVLSCTKGIELDSGLRMSEILAESFPEAGLAVLTGPNHAEEVSQRMATAAVVAARETAVSLAVQECFTLPWFRCYTSDDVPGVEWGGALKNPYAIAAGIAQGLHLGDNAIAALVTRALAEMVRLGVAKGGQAETFFGLSGVGDLVATCSSPLSRNRHFGELLGPGGLLVLLEITRRPFWLDLVFGLNEGWWRFADRELRPDHALLSTEGWRELLAREGFADVQAFHDDAPDGVPGQSVLVARAPVAARSRARRRPRRMR